MSPRETPVTSPSIIMTMHESLTDTRVTALKPFVCRAALTVADSATPALAAELGMPTVARSARISVLRLDAIGTLSLALPP